MPDIAIHHRPGSFSDRWLEALRERGISHRVVDALRPDIIEQLEGASAFMWHFAHGLAADLLVARHILEAVAMRMHVFPNRATCWHFDDKVAQKYLLESAGAPHVRTWAFYDLDAAMSWIDQASFPKVFKLRRGSGSRNVRRIDSRDEARAVARQAFRNGFAPSGGYVGQGWKIGRALKQNQLLPFLTSLPEKVARRVRLDRFAGREIGYVYFQEFVPENTHDIRVTVVGNRAFAFTRDVRPGDFRASGSGRIVYERSRISEEFVSTAFQVCRRIGSQSMAFDFLRDASGKPLIVEVSYGYDSKPVRDCPGHWDDRLQWHEGHVWAEHAILDDVVTAVSPKVT